MLPAWLPALWTVCCIGLSLAHAHLQYPGTISVPRAIPKTTVRPIIANITTSDMPIQQIPPFHFGVYSLPNETSFQNLSFSSSGFPEWRAYTVKTFSKQSPETIFSTSTLSLCLSTLTTLSTHLSATDIPTPSVFALVCHPKQLILFAYSTKELTPTTCPPSLLITRHIHLSLCQCLQ